MKKKRQTLAVTLLVLNDQKNLNQCLSAIKNIADEIIVGIDDKTTDNSLAIAKKYTKHVYVLPHKDNFHINKKIINEKAKSDWVLSLDSDEFVTKKLSEEISKLLEGDYFGYDSWLSPLRTRIHKFLPFLFPLPKKLTKPAAAYYLPRKNFFLNRYLNHSGQYPDPITRFFKNGLAYWPAKDVHEQMVVKGQIGWLAGDLDHYATPEFERYLTRENRYSSLYAQDLYDAGVTINLSSGIKYLIVKPITTFLWIYFRHRGVLDGFPGFVFALFSGIHFQLSYMKLWELYRIKK